MSVTNDEHNAYGELGQTTPYDTVYNPDRLFPILRAPKRVELDIDEENLPFFGVDIWNHYEVSWLDASGKPCVATARIMYDCKSPYLIESKSLKLYFNSLNQEKFESVTALEACIKRDLSARLKTDVMLEVVPSSAWHVRTVLPKLPGYCVDDLPVTCHQYQVDADLLAVTSDVVDEVLCSDLLRSNCPVTNQPDWGSVQVAYQGPRIIPESFLKYIVSYRNHQGFHEQCIEQIFMDILKHCRPSRLTVYGRYTRRGGLDINPYRSTEAFDFSDELFQLAFMRQ